jgi:hypothetical protein
MPISSDLGVQACLYRRTHEKCISLVVGFADARRGSAKRLDRVAEARECEHSPLSRFSAVIA